MSEELLKQSETTLQDEPEDSEIKQTVYIVLFGLILGILVLLIVCCIIRYIRLARIQKEDVRTLQEEMGKDNAPVGKGRTSLAPL